MRVAWVPLVAMGVEEEGRVVGTEGVVGAACTPWIVRHVRVRPSSCARVQARIHGSLEVECQRSGEPGSATSDHLLHHHMCSATAAEVDGDDDVGERLVRLGTPRAPCYHRRRRFHRRRARRSTALRKVPLVEVDASECGPRGGNGGDHALTSSLVAGDAQIDPHARAPARSLEGVSPQLPCTSTQGGGWRMDSASGYAAPRVYVQCMV